MKASNFWGIGIIFFISLPYLLLLSKVGIIEPVATGSLLWVIQNTLIQASGSASIALVLGFLGALGIVGIKNKKLKNITEAIILLPSFLPSLFVVLSILVIFKTVPKKNISIVLIQGFIYSGLVAVAFSQIIQGKLGRLAELSLVEGASFWQFIYTGLISYLKKDLLHIWLFVFGIALSSFSIPLLVGGVMGTNLEVLIYEKIVLIGDWNQGLALSLLQFFLLIIFSMLVRDQRFTVSKTSHNMNLIHKPWLAILFVGLTFSLLLSPLLSLKPGLSQLQTAGFTQPEITELFIQTLVVAFTGVFAVVLGGLLLSLSFASRWTTKILRVYSSPSLVLLGFVFLISPILRDLDFHAKIAFAFFWLAMPSLYRWGLASFAESLKLQMETAQVMGAGWAQIWRAIVVPQITPTLFKMGGLAAIWAAGDFALLGFLSSHEVNLSLASKLLLNSYRIHGAMVLSLGALAVGLFCYLLISGVAGVGRKKSI